MTLVSRRIDRPFRLEMITARFAPGCQNLLYLEPWLSADDDAPTSGNPAGVNLLQDYSQAHTIRGDAEQIVLPVQASVKDAGYFLKILAVNDDYFDHPIDVDIQITLDPEKAV